MGKRLYLTTRKYVLYFRRQCFTIWAGYTQKYAAFDYNVRILTSREGETHFSVVRQNQGYIQDTMTSIGNELTPINKIEGNEPTTIKKLYQKVLKSKRVVEIERF